MLVYLIFVGAVMIVSGAIAKGPLLDRDIYINAGIIVVAISVSALMIIIEISKGHRP